MGNFIPAKVSSGFVIMSPIVDDVRQGEARWDLEGDQATGHLGQVEEERAGDIHQVNGGESRWKKGDKWQATLMRR